MTGLLTTLENLVADRLRTDPELSSIPILVEQQGDLITELDKRISAGTAFLLVSVNSIADTQKPRESSVRILVTAREQCLINRGRSGSGLTARDLAELALSRLGGWQPSPSWSPFRAHRLEFIASEDPTTLIYQTSAETTTVLSYQVDLAP